jgi:hypothetical protein
MICFRMKYCFIRIFSLFSNCGILLQHGMGFHAVFSFSAKGRIKYDGLRFMKYVDIFYSLRSLTVAYPGGGVWGFDPP